MAYTAIDKSTDHFNTVLFTGTHSSVPTITVGFKSDFLWLKSRTQTYDHNVLDTTRGGSSKIFPNKTDKQSTTGDSVTFNATNFQPSGQAINESGQGTNNMVSWSWKANGGTTASNSSGSITSTVQTNTTAGISIVKYDGTGSNATVGHGLGVAPAAIIMKNYTRTAAQSWIVAHRNLPTGFNDAIFLDLTNAKDSDSVYWNNTAPTSTVFSIGTNDKCNGNGDAHIAYCFAQKTGFSKFGSYPGNGLTNGPFIYTGFKPAWVMIKRTDDTANWHMYDNKRDDSNVVENALQANTSAAEFTTSNKLDFYSNGFKSTAANQSTTNTSGGNYIYMAFAENPFVSSAGVPTTAR